MNISVKPSSTRAADGLPRRRFTVAEVEAMVDAGILDEDERIELIGGELVPMSPKGRRHEAIRVSLNDHWCRVRPEACRVAPETMFRLSEDTFLEPDFVIYTHPTPLTSLSQSNVLLVVEIAASSRRLDMGRKAKIYARFGVRELWVIDVLRRMTRTFRAPSERGYAETRDYIASERIMPLFAPSEFALSLDKLELA